MPKLIKLFSSVTATLLTTYVNFTNTVKIPKNYYDDPVDNFYKRWKEGNIDGMKAISDKEDVVGFT